MISTDYFVATNGNDQWSGKLPDPDPAGTDGPFASIDRARDQVRTLKGSAGLSTPINIFIREGVYSLGQTFTLTPEDSGTAEAPIAYRAYDHEKPVLTGGRPITGFKPYKGEILQADVGQQGFKGIYFRDLFCQGQRQHLARYPNYDPNHPYGGGWALADGKTVNMLHEVPGENNHSMVYRPEDERHWPDPQTGEVFVFPRYNWWNSTVGIKTINRKTRTLTLADDCTYPVRPGDRYYVRNLLEELDAPGEWFLDRKTWTLYFWPPVPLEKSAVYAPILDDLIEFSPGTAYINIKGLTFECAARNGIVMRESEHCLIAGNTIRNVSTACEPYQAGVFVDGGHHNGVAGNDVYEVGAQAILLDGGDRRTLTPGHNYADNNYIHHTGVYYKQGVGVLVSGCGNRVSHNLIHDCPRMGIIFTGNNLTIEYNHIRHVNLETEDTGAIYTNGRDWVAARGSVVRYNYIHHALGFSRKNRTWASPHFSWGIYLDDNAAGVDIIGNIVVGAHSGQLHLHNGRDNVIENNIFIGGTTQQVLYTGWSKRSQYWKHHLPTMVKSYAAIKDQPAWQDMRNIDTHPQQAPGPDNLIMSGNIFRRNIVYYLQPKADLYKLIRVPLDRNHWDSNLYWHDGMSLAIPQKNTPKKDEWATWQQAGQDIHSVIADPLFVAPEKGDYRLEKDSPAFAIGFKPIPVDKIGPYQSDQRAHWPIREANGAREYSVLHRR